MTSARPMLERWEDFNLSLAGKNKSKKFVEIVQKYRNATDIHFVGFLLHESGDIVNEALRGGEAFPFDPEYFRNFQPEILPEWKAPQFLQKINFHLPQPTVGNGQIYLISPGVRQK